MCELKDIKCASAGTADGELVCVGACSLLYHALDLMPQSLIATQIGEVEIIYNGGSNMTVTTELYVNWPTTKFATIPLIAFVQCVHMRGVVWQSLRHLHHAAIFADCGAPGSLPCPSRAEWPVVCKLHRSASQ